MCIACLSFEKTEHLYAVFKALLINKSKIMYFCRFYLKACDISFYGVRCTEKCGHCSDGNLCDHINGTCATGCSAGYQGDLCKSRE